MTLEEQWESGLSKEEKERYEEIVKKTIPVIGLDLGPVKAYIKWLEEKLTWKKFGEQQPDIGSKVLTRTSLFGDIEYFAVIERCHIFAYTSVKDSEWMYVPE